MIYSVNKALHLPAIALRSIAARELYVNCIVKEA